MKQRILSPYEKNHLRKYGISEESALSTESPVEYLSGFADFCDNEFIVSPDVLIPRVETEELVNLSTEVAQKNYQKNKKKLSIVEIGTGSGAIAISVANKLTSLNIPFQFEAFDISVNALSIAKKNYQKVGANLPITFKKSDLLIDHSENKKIDLLIANLPYIPSERISNLEPSVKNFEPHLALDGGKDGLSLVRKMLLQAKDKLNNDGIILLELDITHTKIKLAEFENNWDIKIRKDSMGGVIFASFQKR